MSEREVEQLVLASAAKIYRRDISELSRQTAFEGDLGTKSLSLISLISLVSDELDVVISHRDAMQCKTLGDIIDKAVSAVEEEQ